MVLQQYTKKQNKKKNLCSRHNLLSDIEWALRLVKANGMS